MTTLNRLTEIQDKTLTSTFKKRFSIVEVAGMEVLIEDKLDWKFNMQFAVFKQYL